jgi:ABC-type transporter Mla maintaining outer membrane lipid asymmetry ATPase subunit MlaF/ABC-type transporter Mla maintaining outer membrane lipid asymmetry permease subunit MlaE
MNISPGEFSVLLGGSGVGKSLLLRLLAGIFPEDGAVSWSGNAEITAGQAGLVFQDGALFDDLSVMENLRFATDHGGRLTPSELNGLLDRLQIDPDLDLSRASGGQRRRVAVARTLASDPPVLLFDEPTAGLDMDSSCDVASLVRETHEKSGKTTLVVTHDIQSFLGVADSIWFLDPVKRNLQKLENPCSESLRGRFSLRQETKSPVRRLFSWKNFGTNVVSGLAATGRVGTLFPRALVRGIGVLIPRPPRIRWGLHYLFLYLRLVAGPGAWLYVSMAGAVIGFVATYFTFEFFPYEEYTRPLVTEEVLGALGFALFRVLVPLLVTLMIAARCGAAVAADLGNRTFSGQMEAMRTLRASPERYFPTAVVWAFLIGAPFLIGLSFWIARGVSLLVFLHTHPEMPPALLDVSFHQFLTPSGGGLFQGVGWVLSKTLAAGAMIGLVAHARGVGPKRNSGDVARGVTRTVIDSTLLVLLVHLVFALKEF